MLIFLITYTSQYNLEEGEMASNGKLFKYKTEGLEEPNTDQN